MKAYRHIVQSGESLSLIAERYLGDMHAWPQIVAFNNDPANSAVSGTRITDPDLILVGQSIMVPLAHPSDLACRPPVHSERGPRRTKKPDGPGSRPALPRIESPTLKYDLDEIGEMKVFGFGWTATVTLSGGLQMQEKKVETLVTVNQKGFEVGAKSRADKVLESLVVRSVDVGYDATTGDVTFENAITVNSTRPYAPSTSLATGITMLGQPYVKATIKARDLEGDFDGFAYAVAELKVTIKVETNPDTALPKAPVPVTVPVVAPAPQGTPFYRNQTVQLVAGAIVLTAVVVAVAIIAAPVAVAAYASVAGMVNASVGVGGAIAAGAAISSL